MNGPLIGREVASSMPRQAYTKGEPSDYGAMTKEIKRLFFAEHGEIAMMTSPVSVVFPLTL